MLDIMSNCMYTLKRKYATKEAADIIVPIVGHLKLLYEACAGFGVIGNNKEEGLFRIKRTDLSMTEARVWHDINVSNEICSCGKWQEREYPCIDAMAFYRNYEHMTFEKILSTKVSGYYNYDSLHKLYKDNITSVSLTTLVNDELTMPPPNIRKRQAGRPKTRLLRKRSKYATPEESIIICALCNQRGHNRRTCEARNNLQIIKTELEKQQKNSGNDISEATVALAIDPGYASNMM